MGQPQRPPNKYSSPPAAAPVNLTQPKTDLNDDLTYNYGFMTNQAFGGFHAAPYTLYQSPYTPMIRSNFGAPALSPLEQYSPTTPTAISTGTFLTPPSTYSPPSKVVREKKLALPPSFKVPSGKEGSRKHIILTRPEDALQRWDLQRSGDIRLPETTRRRVATVSSPPQSPAKPFNNNNAVSGNFKKGSLILLANGKTKLVEDMRTEDFVQSVERSPELQLADSTVVRIEENPITGTTTITLSYNQRRTQVELYKFNFT